MSILVFTTATEDYEFLACLFASFVLMHSEDTRVEIGVDEPPRFEKRYRNQIDCVRDLHGEGALVISQAVKGIGKGTPRFVTVPRTKAEHVYISDIDILLLDPHWTHAHLNNMRETGLPYSNSLRDIPKDQAQRLTGLHFTRWDALYPLPDLSDLDLDRMNDEHVLYSIVTKLGHALPTERFRPVHGIHCSVKSRAPFVSVSRGRKTHGWGLGDHGPAFMRAVVDPRHKALMPHLCSQAHTVLQVTEMMILMKEHKLEPLLTAPPPKRLR